MFLATSEMAVAISVCSVLDRPLSAASSRPFWRAVTMSVSWSIGTWVSPGIASTPSDHHTGERQALLEIEGGVHAIEGQPELDHGEGDVGLDPNHHRPRAPELRRLGDPADRAAPERVDDVERGHVDDHGAAPETSDALGELVSKLDERAVRQRLLQRGDEDVPLLHDRDRHASLSTTPARSGRPRPRARCGS